MDGWDFKQFVLGTLFYRFISENFVLFMENGDESIDYTHWPDEQLSQEDIHEVTKEKGFSIYPSQLVLPYCKECEYQP